MGRDSEETPIARLRSYEASINKGDIEGAAAVFLDDASVEEEGVLYPSARAVHEYDVGSQAHIVLSDFSVRGDHITCTYHYANALDRALGYAGTRRTVEFTFIEGCIARMVIQPPDPDERIYTQQLTAPFFDWIRQNHPEQWSTISTLTYKGGKTLAAMARAWRAIQGQAGG